jgi:glycosyltransferase involved in cell wall biosynthesis
LVLAGFYGHPLVPLIRALTSAPILFDPFVSTYDTLVLDRARFAQGSPAAQATFHLDRRALGLADGVLTDTHTHGDFYRQTFGVPLAQRLHNLYLGCDETLFVRRAAPLADFAEDFVVFTYSSYQPLHGMATIVQAAKRCEGFPITFRLLGGEGPTYRQVRQMAETLQVRNVHFEPSASYTALPAAIARSTLCLGGHFGATPKARRVIAGKSYQFIAMGKPVVMADNPANQELFEHGATAYFCAPNDPEALARAILALYRQPDLRTLLAENANRLFRDALTWEILGAQLATIVRGLL